MNSYTLAANVSGALCTLYEISGDALRMTFDDWLAWQGIETFNDAWTVVEEALHSFDPQHQEGEAWECLLNARQAAAMAAVPRGLGQLTERELQTAMHWALSLAA